MTRDEITHIVNNYEDLVEHVWNVMACETLRQSLVEFRYRRSTNYPQDKEETILGIVVDEEKFFVRWLKECDGYDYSHMEMTSEHLPLDLMVMSETELDNYHKELQLEKEKREREIAVVDELSVKAAREARDRSEYERLRKKYESLP